jgi:hypothetical protein
MQRKEEAMLVLTTVLLALRLDWAVMVVHALSVLPN